MDKKFTPMEMEDGSSVTPPDDYTELQKEMLCLKEENEILKKLWHILEKSK